MYSHRRIPDYRVFSDVHTKISETGSVFTVMRERDASNYDDKRDEVELEEQIIVLVTKNPRFAILAVKRTAPDDLSGGY